MTMQFRSQELEAYYQLKGASHQQAGLESYLFWPNAITSVGWYLLVKTGQMEASPRNEVTGILYMTLLAVQFLASWFLPSRLKSWNRPFTLALRVVYPLVGIWTVSDHLSNHREYLSQPGTHGFIHWAFGAAGIVVVFHTLLLPMHFKTHIKLQTCLVPCMLVPILQSLVSTADSHTRAMCMKAWSQLDALDVILQATAPHSSAALPMSSLPCHATLMLIQLVVGVMLPALLFYIMEAHSRAVFIEQLRAGGDSLSAEARQALSTADSTLVSVVVYPLLMFFMTLPLVFQVVKLGLEAWAYFNGPGPLTATLDDWKAFYGDSCLIQSIGRNK